MARSRSLGHAPRYHLNNARLIIRVDYFNKPPLWVDKLNGCIMLVTAELVSDDNNAKCLLEAIQIIVI